MEKYYTKDGKRWTGGSIVHKGHRIFNPKPATLIAAGYEEHEEQPYTPTLAEVKARKIAEIDRYDTSEAVNSFTLDGQTVWLDYDMRQRMRTKIEAALRDGSDTATLWLGTACFELPCDIATNLIWLVEKYAAACYDVTASHKAAVEALTDIAAVEAYDYTQGYPEKLNISTTSEQSAS